MCSGHYARWNLGKPVDATPLGRCYKGIPVEERFWPRVDKSGDCWLWTGPIFDGYGRIKIGRELNYVHRLSYEWANGPVPDGLLVDHKCHNRACVRPDHMQAVTHELNQQNRSREGTGVSGLRGVTWQKSRQQWRIRTYHNGKRLDGGYFDTLEEAGAAIVAWRNQLKTNNLADRVVDPAA